MVEQKADCESWGFGLKVLITNNHLDPKENEELAGAVGGFCEYKTVSYKAIDAEYEPGEDIGAIILSGSKARIVDPDSVAEFKHVASLIRRIEVPLLGICFGHQLICLTLGARVGALGSPVKDRFEKVRVIRVNDLFWGFRVDRTIPLAEWHSDYVKRDGLSEAGFELLADSSSCEVEAVKHRFKPLYGVQFHPERFRSADGGEEHKEGLQIIRNFCSVAKQMS